MKIYRTITSDRVREMCIRYDYYTCGDCDEYSLMLAEVDTINEPDLVDEFMLPIARNILEHSDVERLECEYGCSRAELLVDVVYKLYNECTETVVEWTVGEV